MRREMQEITPGLFLGPYSCARDLQSLISKNITHMLCIRDQTETHIIKLHFQDQLVYKVVEVSDCADSNLIPFFAETNRFIHEAIQKGECVFVYCNSGISRSPAVVTSYLMVLKALTLKEYHNMSYKEAFTAVMQKRFCVNPNECFKYQLRGYESMYEDVMTLGYKLGMQPSLLV